MDKRKEDEVSKTIEFDKTTAQLHACTTIRRDMLSASDNTKVVGHHTEVITQVIHKEGIQQVLANLAKQKVAHTESLNNAETMLAGEKTALEIIDVDIKRINEVIGDLKFKEEDVKPESNPSK